MSTRSPTTSPPPVILASGSPRRREFLQRLGIPFQVHVADVDERSVDGETPEQLVARLSRDKAAAVAARFPRAAIVGADTIVTLDGALLGKPDDEAHAEHMLRRLRDRPHKVYSGVTVCPPDGGTPRTEVVESTVWMRPYSDDEIHAYVASGDPLDKAGAYAIQNASFHPVARLSGCYASVMGLPICELGRMLAEIGVHTRVSARTVCLDMAGGESA